MKDDADITFMGSSSFDQEVQKADFGLESMLDDEIMFVSRNEDEEADSDRELYVVDENEAIKVIDTLVSIANKEDTDTTISTTHDPTISYVFASSSAPNTSQRDALGALQQYKEIQITKVPGSDPLSHLPRRMDFLTTHVHNLGLSLLDKVADKMDSSVPRMMLDAFEKMMLELLSNTLKNILPHLLNDPVNKLMPKFDKRVKKTLKYEVLEVVLGPLYKEFNSLNKLEGQRFVILEKKLRNSIRNTIQKSILHSSVKLVEIVTQLVHIIDSVATPVNTATKREQGSQAQPDLGIETSQQNRGQVHSLYNFRDDPIPITKFSYRVNNVLKEATMRITRDNQLLNLKIYEKFILKMLGFSKWLELHALASKKQSASNEQLLKNLKAKFQWVATITGKIGILPESQLTAFELPTAKKKRKRRTEPIQEVFLEESIMVDGMQRKLVPLVRVVGSAGLVINEDESGFFVYNRSFDLVESVIAQEMYDKMIYVIKARDDVVEASKIIQENLDNLGSLELESEEMAKVDINTLIMEQYLALTCENQGPRVVRPKIGSNVNFEIKGTDNQEKDEKQSQNDKTGLGMEKTVKDKAKSKPESQSSQKVNRKVNWSKSKSTQVNPEAKVKEI
ncbi:hypothetical protein Tco_0840882 [Tanacetum coccineum]|uniref:Uncharacterized protein n=1 Tax=Tanacetum coccineum TaxID=301880 RepID=A0ABQ5AV68_9ASTR